MSTIGERLRAVRSERGLTLASVAEAAGCTHSYLSQIENGKKEPSRTLVTALATRLVLSERWLLTGEGPRDLVPAPTFARLSLDDDESLVRHMTAMAHEATHYALGSPGPEGQLVELLLAQAAWWSSATPEQRAWFRVQFRREFPEVAAKGKKSV